MKFTNFCDVVGVYKHKENRYVAQIHHFFERGDRVYLGMFYSVEPARSAYQYAYQNKSALVAELQHLPEREDELRKRCKV